MKKIVATALLITILAVLVTPALAFSGIEITVRDSLTHQPWGTVPGQSYRIYVTGSSSGTLLDTGILTTPAAQPLDFVCSYDGPCPTAASVLGTPVAGEQVTIYILLYGTSDEPETIIRSFTQPPTDLGNYIINSETGTGPTAITMQNVDINGSTTPTVVALAGMILLLILTAGVFVRRQMA